MMALLLRLRAGRGGRRLLLDDIGWRQGVITAGAGVTGSITVP